MKTRAAVFFEQGAPLEVRTIDLEEPGPGDVLVRMAAVGICGSDLHVVRGEWHRPVPMVLGHEGSGVVAAVGRDVTGLAPGDPVVVSWAPACGECGPCLRGRPGACLRVRDGITAGTLPDGTTRMKLDGELLYRMTTVGALADHVLMPAASVLPLPGDVPLRDAALLGCAALTGVGAVANAAGVEQGATVLVIGAGGVGQFVIQGARIAGAGTIIAADPAPERRAMAVELGATHAVAPDELDATVAAVTPEGVDYAFEAVGHAELEADALRHTRAGGKAVLVGLPPTGSRMSVDPYEFAAREKTLTGSIYGSEDPARSLPSLLARVADGSLRLTSLLGSSFTLDEVNEAVALALAGEAGRVLVEFGDAPAA